MDLYFDVFGCERETYMKHWEELSNTVHRKQNPTVGSDEDITAEDYEKSQFIVSTTSLTPIHSQDDDSGIL